MMATNEGTVFGEPTISEAEAVKNAPRVCAGCGSVGKVFIYHNLDTDELTLECEQCGEEYDPESSLESVGLSLTPDEGDEVQIDEVGPNE